MAITYTWRMREIKIVDQTNSEGKVLKDAVVQTLWQKIGKDDEGNEGIFVGATPLTAVNVPEADFKFYITASIKIRALRRFKELKKIKKKVTYLEVLKSIKKRDKSDLNRKISPLIKTKDSLLINTTNLNKRACFLKIKKIIDRKIKN